MLPILSVFELLLAVLLTRELLLLEPAVFIDLSAGEWCWQLVGICVSTNEAPDSSEIAISAFESNLSASLIEVCVLLALFVLEGILNCCSLKLFTEETTSSKLVESRIENNGG